MTDSKKFKDLGKIREDKQHEGLIHNMSETTMLQGKIIKGIGGFYYVHVPHKGIFECRARGIFRKENIKPLIGDNVMIALIDEAEKTGQVEEILERTNQLIRPTVANIDQAVIVFSVSRPEPNFNLLDRFLLMIMEKGIQSMICFNKTDTMSQDEVVKMSGVYEKAGYKVLLTSTMEDQGIEYLKEALYNKTSVFAGPSGVGKSSLLNKLQCNITLETGNVSDKIGRGKHTTRHAELLSFHDDAYVVDTPGFSSLDINHIKAEEVGQYFLEFGGHEPYCRFQGCKHLGEPDCGIKDGVAAGEIAASRYESYTQIMNELMSLKKW